MASGYFPLDKYDTHSDTLFNVAEELEIVISEHLQAAAENLTAEDAAQDGIYLGYLRVAVELIRKCLKEEA